MRAVITKTTGVLYATVSYTQEPAVATTTGSWVRRSDPPRRKRRRSHLRLVR